MSWVYKPDEEKDDIDLPPPWVSCIEISQKGNIIFYLFIRMSVYLKCL